MLKHLGLSGWRDAVDGPSPHLLEALNYAEGVDLDQIIDLTATLGELFPLLNPGARPPSNLVRTTPQEILAAVVDLERIAGEASDRVLHLGNLTVPKGHSGGDWHVNGFIEDMAKFYEIVTGERTGGYDVLVAEGLDRLSRDQADVATLYKLLSFCEIRIVTVAEGEVSELHVGLKGTMNALSLRDLALKTHRGLSGRVKAGKSGGGNSYGYDVVRGVDENGEPLRGERRVNEAEAAIVRRIFAEYAAGASPRAIARRLNAECIASPSGKGWGPSTIHGNRQRGTGILNNELYVGKLVWNRLRYLKDPQTGKRVSRPNRNEEVIIHEVPNLRIVKHYVWDRAKARQRSLDASHSGKYAPGYWDRRRPRFLLTGLMKCGACGGGFVNFNKVYIGCANARNKGTCDNKLTMHRTDLETMVLEGLQYRLLDGQHTKIFCEEFAREMNRLRSEAGAERDAVKSELARINRELDRLVQALMDGVPSARVKDKLGELKSRKKVLEARLSETREDNVRVHPNMATYYRKKVGDLRSALTGDHFHETAEIIRSLIEEILLTPVEKEGRKSLSINLNGDIASILALAAKAKAPMMKATPACVSQNWLRGQDLNLRPSGYEFALGPFRRNIRGPATARNCPITTCFN